MLRAAPVRHGHPAILPSCHPAVVAQAHPRLPNPPLQAEKIEQLNLEREAARQQRLRRLQPAAVRADAPPPAAEAESAP